MRRLVALAVLVPLLGACGGSNGNPPLEAFSQCMRSHGVKRFPDPRVRIGLVIAPQVWLGLSPALVRNALQGCKHLLPKSQPGSGGSHSYPAAAPAPGPGQTRFITRGSTLTVVSGNRTWLRLVQGHRVMATCTTALLPTIGIGGSHWTNSNPVRWSRNAEEASFTVPSQVLRRATACNLAIETSRRFGVIPGSNMTAGRGGL